MKHYKVVIIFVLSVILFGPMSWATSNNSAYTLAQSKSAITKSQAAEIAKKKYGGKVLKVKKIEKNGEPFYQIRIILDNGKVKTITINAQKNTTT